MKGEPSLIITVDYEIFGNGSGCVDRCVLAPTEKMGNVAERFEAPLTFFVEVLEFLSMEQEAGTIQQAEAVIAQLQQMVSSGHDAQLHLHPQFCRARWSRDGWIVGATWRCGDETEEDINRLISLGKRWLERHLSKCSPGYRCLAFRAGGWCIQPSALVVRALLHNGIFIDSTVVPGFVNYCPGEWFDFSNVPEAPFWKTDGDVCGSASDGLWELPIAAGRIGRLRHLHAIIAARSAGCGGMADGCRGNYQGTGSQLDSVLGRLRKVFHLGQVKLDVSTMPADVLIEISRQWLTRFAWADMPIPLIAIAHTKNFTDRSADSLASYLAWAKSEGIKCTTYGSWLETVGA